jgi:hypothetical protein
MQKFLLAILVFALIVLSIPYMPSYIVSSPLFQVFILFFMGAFVITVVKA